MRDCTRDRCVHLKVELPSHPYIPPLARHLHCIPSPVDVDERDGLGWHCVPSVSQFYLPTYVHLQFHLTPLHFPAFFCIFPLHSSFSFTLHSSSRYQEGLFFQLQLFFHPSILRSKVFLSLSFCFFLSPLIYLCHSTFYYFLSLLFSCDSKKTGEGAELPFPLCQEVAWVELIQ